MGIASAANDTASAIAKAQKSRGAKQLATIAKVNVEAIETEAFLAAQELLPEVKAIAIESYARAGIPVHTATMAASIIGGRATATPRRLTFRMRAGMQYPPNKSGTPNKGNVYAAAGKARQQHPDLLTATDTETTVLNQQWLAKTKRRIQRLGLEVK